MVRVTVLYPNESAKRFDHDYLLQQALAHGHGAAQGFWHASLLMRCGKLQSAFHGRVAHRRPLTITE
jgi:hypothetical protein